MGLASSLEACGGRAGVGVMKERESGLIWGEV